MTPEERNLIETTRQMIETLQKNVSTERKTHSNVRGLTREARERNQVDYAKK